MANQHIFQWEDYLIFTLTVILSGFVGIYFWCRSRKKTTTSEFFTGSRTSRVIPVTLSLIVSRVSGTLVLGFPVEIYLYGMQFLYGEVTALLTGVAVAYLFIPVFYELGNASLYEYLEARFDKNARKFGSFLFACFGFLFMPITMYTSAIALGSMIDFNMHIIVWVSCIVCAFYTCMGGFNAVVWTDVLQAVIMVITIVTVAVAGTLEFGGLSVIAKDNLNSGRIEGIDFSFDVKTRYNFWVLTVGLFFLELSLLVPNQVIMQRVVSMPTLNKGRIVMVLCMIGSTFFILVCGYGGLVLHTVFRDCDPVKSGVVTKYDEMLPLLVKKLRYIRTLPGLFAAGMFSASLSTVSSFLNSMSAILLEDFYRPMFKKQLNEQHCKSFMRVIVVVLACACAAMVLLVEKLSTITQLTLTFVSVESSALLSLFIMGVFVPNINARGALIGTLVGTAFVGWIGFGSQAAIASGSLSYQTKPLPTHGCNLTNNYVNIRNSTLQDDDLFPLYKISYLWFTFIGVIVSMIAALLVSCCSGSQQYDPKLVHPLLRKYVRTKKDKSPQSIKLLD